MEKQVQAEESTDWGEELRIIVFSRSFSSSSTTPSGVATRASPDAVMWWKLERKK
jgi:hypothetical protein